MKINSIKKTKSGKYKVNIDGVDITTYDDVLIDNKILYKKELDNDDLLKIEKDNVYYDAYNKTLNYIVRRLRSKKETIDYLNKFELSQDDKDKIIKRLVDNGFINDINYTKAYISDSIYLSNDGPYKIREYLIQQDIDEETIDEELSKIDKDIIVDKAYKIISKKFNSNRKYSTYQLNQKITVDMVNLGYSRDMINELLVNFSFDDDDLLESEYNKIYNKLSKKYQDNELFYKIKQKLYAKGFDINKINRFIDKKKR